VCTKSAYTIDIERHTKNCWHATGFRPLNSRCMMILILMTIQQWHSVRSEWPKRKQLPINCPHICFSFTQIIYVMSIFRTQQTTFFCGFCCWQQSPCQHSDFSDYPAVNTDKLEAPQFLQLTAHPYPMVCFFHLCILLGKTNTFRILLNNIQPNFPLYMVSSVFFTIQCLITSSSSSCSSKTESKLTVSTNDLFITVLF